MLIAGLQKVGVQGAHYMGWAACTSLGSEHGKGLLLFSAKQYHLQSSLMAVPVLRCWLNCKFESKSVPSKQREQHMHARTSLLTPAEAARNTCARMHTLELTHALNHTQDASTQLGGMGVMHSTHTVAFMLANGFGCAAATRVANELGGWQCCLFVEGAPASKQRARQVDPRCSPCATAGQSHCGCRPFCAPWCCCHTQKCLALLNVLTPRQRAWQLSVP